MSVDLISLSAVELLKLYQAKSTSPVEVTKAALAHIDRHDGELNAFRFVDHEAAMDSARQSEDRWVHGKPTGLLDGIPTTIKDSHHVKGWTTLHGSKLSDPTVAAKEDSPHVARLREHGAVFLGKTNLCEQGWKCVTDSPLSGISRNPWDSQKTPGGSSGGAAISAAIGFGVLHMGGDGGGSIRAPASLCGVFGFKATFGRIPKYPQESLIQCTHFGPLTRTVADSALAMNVITRPDRRDVVALPFKEIDYLEQSAHSIGGAKVGYCDTLGGVKMDPEVARICRKAAQDFEQIGATIDEVDPGLGESFEAYKVLNSAYQAPKIQGKTQEQLAQMDQNLVGNARIGETLSALDLLEAGKVRAHWIERLARYFEQYDLLVTPTLPNVAFEVGRNNPEFIEAGRSDTDRLYSLFNSFLYQFNYTHHPAASVACGKTDAGLPVGLQLVGRISADIFVLRCCRAFEMRQPAFTPPF